MVAVGLMSRSWGSTVVGLDVPAQGLDVPALSLDVPALTGSPLAVMVCRTTCSAGGCVGLVWVLVAVSCTAMPCGKFPGL